MYKIYFIVVVVVIHDM